MLMCQSASAHRPPFCPSHVLMSLLTGTTLSAVHFVPGQFVDVIAKSYVYMHSAACTSLIPV